MFLELERNIMIGLIMVQPHLNYGIGFNYELNKNLSIEGTINPDFSQVESDATKIDINSPTALNYPEKRPFFLEELMQWIIQQMFFIQDQ